MAQCSYALLMHGHAVAVSCHVAILRQFDPSDSLLSPPLRLRRRNYLSPRRHHLKAGRPSTSGLPDEFTHSNATASTAASIPAATITAAVVMTATQSPESVPRGSEQCFLGLDFGTSGARAVVIDGNGSLLSDIKQEYPTDEKGAHLTAD